MSHYYKGASINILNMIWLLTYFFLFAHDILSCSRFTHLAHFFAEFELIFSGLRSEKPRQNHSAGECFFCIEFARSQNTPWCKAFWLWVGCKAKGLWSYHNQSPFMVRVARLERAASTSQMWRPTNWATPGYWFWKTDAQTAGTEGIQRKRAGEILNFS